MPTEKYTAANDNHEQRYAAFNDRLSQFMRGERTIPASMSDEEWCIHRNNAEMRHARRSMRRVLNPIMVAV